MKRLKRIARFYGKETVGAACRLFGAYLIRFLYRKNAGLLVLNYHSFSRYNNYRLTRGDLLETDYQQNFERQVTWLNQRFGFTTPENFYGKKSKGFKCFLTFDDGYRDNFELAYPILKKHGLPAAFFIVTSFPDTENWLLHDKIRYLAQTKRLDANQAEEALSKLNQGKNISDELLQCVQLNDKYLPKRRLMMNWDEIRTLYSEGFSIGSHTHRHSPLLFLEQEDREKELETASRLLAIQTGQNINYFAYPNGLYDEHCSSSVQHSGIEYAFTTVAGCNKFSDSPLEIKRIGVNASDSIGVLVLKLLLNMRK